MPSTYASGMPSTFLLRCDHFGELILADFGAMRAPERGIVERVQAPTRPLGTRSGGETGVLGGLSRFHLFKAAPSRSRFSKSRFSLVCAAPLAAEAAGLQTEEAERPPWASASFHPIRRRTAAAECPLRRTAQPAHQGDILLPVHFICDRRTHAGAAGLKLKQLLALVGAISQQPAVVNHLESQISGRRHHAAADAAASRSAPNQLLSHRIPRFQHPALLAQGLRPDEGHGIRTFGKKSFRESGVAVRMRNHFVARGISPVSVSGGNINQAGGRVKRHRRPVMGAARGGINRDRFFVVEGVLVDHGAARIRRSHASSSPGCKLARR